MQGRFRIGLEIGEGELKLVALRPVATGWQATAAATQPLPPGTIGPAGVENPMALEAALVQLRKQAGLAHAVVEVTCPESVVLFRRFRMPAMRPAQVRKALTLNAAQYIPIAGEEMCADFTVLPASEAEVSVLVAGAPRSHLQLLRQVLGRAGFRPASFSPPAPALGWLLGHWRLAAPGELVAVVVLAAGGIRAHVFRGTSPVAARNLMSTVADGAEALLELRRSLMVEGRLPVRVLVVGESDEGWRQQLANLLNRTFTQADPDVQVEVLTPPPVAAELSSDFSVAAGHALGSQAAVRLNLLRPRLFRTPLPLWTLPAVVTATTLLLVSLYAAWWLPQYVGLRTQSPAQAGGVVQMPGPKETAEIKKTWPVLQELQGAHAWSEVLGAVQEGTPAGVRVAQVVIDGASAAKPAGGQGGGTAGKVAMAGRVKVSGSAQTWEDLTAYVHALREDGHFASVEIDSAQHGAPGSSGTPAATAGMPGAAGISFQLQLDVAGGKGP